MKKKQETQQIVVIFGFIVLIFGLTGEGPFAIGLLVIAVITFLVALVLGLLANKEPEKKEE